jgi:hypothetical protein
VAFLFAESSGERLFSQALQKRRKKFVERRNPLKNHEAKNHPGENP